MKGKAPKGDMKTFCILIVEDDLESRDKLITLMKRSAAELAGANADLEFTTAANQQDAEAAVEASSDYGFDLVMLDLSYPKNGDDSSEDFYGLDWLPHLRRSQPDAAIVVMTAYGYEQFLLRTVRALRDGKADEFIPKNTPWSEMRQRIRDALICASDRRNARLATRLATHPMRSHVARPAAEDILSALQSCRNHLLRVSEDLESEDVARISGAPIAIRSEIEVLRHKLTSVATKLAGPQDEEAKPVNCGLLARDLGGLFQLQLRDRLGRVDTALDGDDLTVLSYDDDLTVALKEVLQNSVFASLRGKPSTPIVSICVRRRGGYVEIVVTDSGDGFVPAAIEHMFEQGNTHWSDDNSDHHSGMGLHVARRMMYAIGGDILAENCEGHARINLLVRDWNQP